MKKPTIFTRLSFLLASVLVVGGITFGVRYEYKQVDAWSGAQTSDAPDNYYSSCDGKEGSALQSQLLSINAPKSTSYDWSRYEAADEVEDDSSSVLSIYTRHSIKKSSHCGNYSWTTWNREHVWTQSKYPKSASDNHNIFACEGQINNYRGNLPFAEVEHTSANTKKVFDHDTGCYWTSSYFEPCDEAKGEIARSVMYGTVMYSYTMTQIFKNIETALKWHLEHPVTNRDIFRNNTVYSLQGNRNPFVDNPSYACKIWGNTNDQTRALCGNSSAEKTLTSVVVSNIKSTLNFGQSCNASAVAKYSDGTSKDVTTSASWKSSNENIATVNAGVVTAKNVVGSTTISATYEGQTGSANLSVSEAPISLQEIEVTSDKNSVQINREIQLTATAKYSNGTTEDITNKASWKSSDNSLALVANDGTVLGLTVCDKVTISATFNDVVGQIVISVTEKAVTPPPSEDPNEPGNNEKEPNNSKKGCKGSIIATSSVLSGLALVGVGFVLIRKRKH